MFDLPLEMMSGIKDSLKSYILSVNSHEELAENIIQDLSVEILTEGNSVKISINYPELDSFPTKEKEKAQINFDNVVKMAKDGAGNIIQEYISDNINVLGDIVKQELVNALQGSMGGDS